MREANASGDPNITPVWVQTFVLIWRLKDHSAREPEGFSTAFPFTSGFRWYLASSQHASLRMSGKGQEAEVLMVSQNFNPMACQPDFSL